MSTQAEFVVCDLCGKHGYLISPNGETTRELCSKDDAARALNVGMKRGWMSYEDAYRVLCQIGGSSLPKEEEKKIPNCPALISFLLLLARIICTVDEPSFLDHFDGNETVH